MKEKSSVNGLMIFLVYGMFALFSLFLVVIGAKVYREVVTSGMQNTSIRSSFVYVSNKIRMSSKETNSIYLDERNEKTFLVLQDGSSGYETVIYFYEGALREYYGLMNEEFDLRAGEKIVSAKKFVIEEVQPGLLKLSMTDDNGQNYSMNIAYNVSRR